MQLQDRALHYKGKKVKVLQAVNGELHDIAAVTCHMG